MCLLLPYLHHDLAKIATSFTPTFGRNWPDKKKTDFALGSVGFLPYFRFPVLRPLMESQQTHNPFGIVFQLRSTNYQPNAITESRQEFTEMEKRIVVLGINQIRDIVKSWQPGHNLSLVIPYSELTEKHHVKVSAAAGTLTSKKIIYQDFTNPNDPQFDYIVPFPRVRSVKQHGKRYLELTMLADVVPSFTELGKRYTAYSIEKMLSLSSVYAQRMYEIISMFYGRGQRAFTYEVSQLRNALNYPANHDYYDFKRKALETAQKELEKTGLHFEFTASAHKGKAVTELTFEVKSELDLVNEDVQADLSLARSMQPHEIAAFARNLIHKYKFTKKQQTEILGNLTLMDTFIKLDAEIHHGKREVNNPTAYVAQSLGFGKPATPKKDPKPAPRAGGRQTKDAVPIGGIAAHALKKMKPE